MSKISVWIVENIATDKIIKNEQSINEIFHVPRMAREICSRPWSSWLRWKFSFLRRLERVKKSSSLIKIEWIFSRDGGASDFFRHFYFQAALIFSWSLSLPAAGWARGCESGRSTECWDWPKPKSAKQRPKTAEKSSSQQQPEMAVGRILTLHCTELI